METPAADVPKAGFVLRSCWGGGNGIKLVIKAGLELAQHIPRVQAMGPGHAPPGATSVRNMATGVDAMRSSENLQPLPSSRAGRW